MHKKLHLQLEVEVEPRVSLFELARKNDTRVSLSQSILKVSISGVSVNSISLMDESYNAIQALSEERAIGRDNSIFRGNERERLLKRLGRLTKRIEKLL